MNTELATFDNVSLKLKQNFIAAQRYNGILAAEQFNYQKKRQKMQSFAIKIYRSNLY